MSLSKNPFVEFLKATLAGGVLFLLPVVLVLIVLHRAMSYALGAAKPISHLLPVERVIGAYGENALAIFMSQPWTRLASPRNSNSNSSPMAPTAGRAPLRPSEPIQKVSDLQRSPPGVGTAGSRSACRSRERTGDRGCRCAPKNAG